MALDDQAFTDQLHGAARGIWEAQREHPFVRGLADGSLDEMRFARWVRQDYLYLHGLSVEAAEAQLLKLRQRLVFRHTGRGFLALGVGALASLAVDYLTGTPIQNSMAAVEMMVMKSTPNLEALD